MSKGKRKSAPGVVVIIRQKLRNRTLTKEDRPILQQCSRLDLIALIEGETGAVLTGSQKNSVAAMINWLLGPEDEGGSAGRLTSRAKKPQTLKKKARQDAEPGPCANAGKASRRSTGLLQVKLEQSFPAPLDSAMVRESDSSWKGDGQIEEAEQANQAVDFRPTHAYSCPTRGQSSDTGQPKARFAHEQAHWLRELQMQLAAAAAAEDDAEDLDAAGTAQSAMRATPVPAVPGDAAGFAPQQLMMFPQQSTVPVGLTDDELESHLLQQLLQDMQLSPQQQQQVTPPLPPHPAPPLQPLQQQQQQLLPQPQPPRQPQQQQLQLPRQLLPEEMHQTQQLERIKQKNLQLQEQLEQSLKLEQHQLLQQHGPLAANLEQQQSTQQQLQQAANLQQQQVLQQQLQLPTQVLLQPMVPQVAETSAAVPGYTSYGLGSVDLGQMHPGPFLQRCLTNSSPLPSTAPESWTGNIPRIFDQEVHSLSSSIPVWPQQACEVTESASMTLKKRDRQQLFQQLLQGSDPAAALTVELSGPSADLTIKRRSLQVSLPGGGESFSAVASAFAGGPFAGRSAQSAPPMLAPPFARDIMDEQQEQHPEMQQQHQEPQRRSGLKKGMKGLAKKFKQLLGGKHSSSSQHQQQQQAPPPVSFAARVGSSASAPAAVRSDDDSAVDLMANIDSAGCAAEPVARPGQQQLTRSAPSNRLPSMSGSFGPGPAGVSSWPSWSATAPGSMTRRVQHGSFVSSFNSFACTTGGSFGTAGGSFADVGACSGSRYENFSERLRVLRAMYNSQYETPKPPEAAAGGSMFVGPAAGASIEPSLPALKEEDMPQAAATAQPEGKPQHTNSPVPFMLKLTKAFGLTPKTEDAEGAAAAAAALAGGLSVTERSNSSFSLFLARVASGWHRDSTSTAAATFHEDSYPPSAVGKGSFSTTAQPSSFSQSARPSLGSYTAERSSFCQSVNFSHPSHPSLGSGRWGVDHSSFSQTVNRSMPSMNTDRSSFSQIVNPSMGSLGAAALGGSFNAAVNPSRASFPGLGSSAQVAAAAAAEAGPEAQPASAAAAAAIEHSPRSFTRTLGLQPGSDTSSQAAGVAPLLDTAGVERSNRSFTKLFGACSGSDAGAAGHMSAVGVEHSRGSFNKLFGHCTGGVQAGSTAASGVEHSRGSFSKLFGACAGGDLGNGAAAAAAHAGAAIEHSRGSFSRLFGPCAGSDPAHVAAMAAPGQHSVDHSRGSFSRLCRGSSSTENGSGSGHGVERSRTSFSKLLGMYAGSDAAAGGADGAQPGKPSCGKLGTERSNESFTKAVGVEKSGSSFSKLFGQCAGCDPGVGSSAAAAAGGPNGLAVENSFRSFTGVEKSSNSISKLFSSCAGCDPTAAGMSHGMQVERSSSSLSKLFGPCAGMDLSAAALVEGSSRSFSRMFASCSNCAGDADLSQHVGVGGASAAADTATDGTLSTPPASIAGSDAAAATVAVVAAVPVIAGAPFSPQPQLESMPAAMDGVVGLDLQLQQQQHLAQQQQLQLQHQQYELQQQQSFLQQLQQQVQLQQQLLHQQPALPAVPEAAAISSEQEGTVSCDTSGMQYSYDPAASAATAAAEAADEKRAPSGYAGMGI